MPTERHVDCGHFPRPPARRSHSSDKAPSYRLFPSVEPTPPTTPIASQKHSLSKTDARSRSRSASFDGTARLRLAAAQQNALTRAVSLRRGRKISVSEVRHMSTVQEQPSPTVSIPYSFLPRSSEDNGHARSNSAPGEFVRDSQTLPCARIDLSKPQWTSKQADSHPAKGLGLSMSASASVDRLDQKRIPPTSRPKPNLTIEIVKDARLKPKTSIIRDNVDGNKPLPPPPPTKSPRHDSRNQSLNGIQHDARDASRKRSPRGSRASSKGSGTSPDSPHPSETTVASHGSFVKAALVDMASPSSPALPRPVPHHTKSDSHSPLSGDIRIKELMGAIDGEAQDDLERPIPPPITPGMPRVASFARMVSVPSLPKTVSVDSPTSKQLSEHISDKAGTSQGPVQSAENIASTEQGQREIRKEEEAAKATRVEIEKRELVQKGSPSESTSTGPPSSISSTSKSSNPKKSKMNLDKPMPSLPPPSSRFSEHRRQGRATDGSTGNEAPPVPNVQDSAVLQEAVKLSVTDGRVKPATEQPSRNASPQTKMETPNPRQTDLSHKEVVDRQQGAASARSEERQLDATRSRPVKAARGPGLSPFPAVAPQPQFYGRGARGESPSRRPMLAQHPPPSAARQRAPPRDSSPARRLPPGHPSHHPEYPAFMPSNQPRALGPPRSRFYGRPAESANTSQVSLVEPAMALAGRGSELSHRKPNLHDLETRAQSPAIYAQAKAAAVRTPPIEQRNIPILETETGATKAAKPPQALDVTGGKREASEVNPALLKPNSQPQEQDLLKRPASPANMGRSPSPTPSQRPNSHGDLLNKSSGAKSLPSLPPELGPRPITPDAVSVLATDTKLTISDPAQTLRDLTKQSEALHARHASLRADRLKLSTSISASLKDSKPGPEYANSLLDQHLSLNAINSSLDICFAKLKSLDCKKEEAIQALVEQAKERATTGRRHRTTASNASHSTRASVSTHSSKVSTPDMGWGPLPALQEKDAVSGERVAKVGPAFEQVNAQSDRSTLHPRESSNEDTSTPRLSTDNDCASLTDGLPTPRPTLITTNASNSGGSEWTIREVGSMKADSKSAEPKRNTMVKMPTISPARSVFSKDLLGMSPVSPIEGNGDDYYYDDAPDSQRRMTVKGAKAAKVLGLVSGRSESPPGITLPDASPTQSRGKELTVELRIPRKPLPRPSPPREVSVPSQPGRKRTNDSSSTVQTDSSPESEARTPRASQEEEDEEEGIVPKSLKIGKKQSVQVVFDDDILDYYSR